MILRIVDMRYPDPFGHEYMYTNAVYDAAMEAGIPVIIYGSDRPIANNVKKVIPLFQDRKWVINRAHNLYSKVFGIISENYYVFKRLKIILNDGIKEDDVFLFHSPFYRHFPAIYFWYHQIRKKPWLILMLRYSHLNPNGNFRCVKIRNYGNIAKQWMVRRFYNDFKKSNLILGTDSEVLSSEFYKMWGIKVVPFPIPVPNQIFKFKNQEILKKFSLLNDCEKNDSLTLVSLGPARDDKGSYLLYEAITEILKQWNGRRIQFFIQTKTSEKGSERTKKNIGLLSSVGPFVKTYDKSLSQEEYWNIFYQANIVLLPYESDEYRARTSGIFAEAMSLGKHVVIPRGTWMEKEINGNTQVVSLFDGRSAASLIKAILNALMVVSKSDRSCIPDLCWKEKHNARSFIDKILKLTGNYHAAN